VCECGCGCLDLRGHHCVLCALCDTVCGVWRAILIPNIKYTQQGGGGCPDAKRRPGFRSKSKNRQHTTGKAAKRAGSKSQSVARFASNSPWPPGVRPVVGA
jgi:hypothetical protein